MHRLVNTSLAEGLLPGSNGFTTVAMTRGLPDSLRVRLEGLCAYAHRTSAHDDTYFQQNPVNWFHLLLPRGEHVIGRIAPADFDYTGRTNRLASLYCLDAVEFPPAGGVCAIRSVKPQLQKPWTEAPRYLDDEGPIACGSPAVPNPVAPAWRRLFGETGENYARRFAQLLQRNLANGGMPIYFRTSAERDVTGSETLELFADLIDLLPVPLRSAVTFSTYAAALPQTAVCHLRGIYDGDAAFRALSAKGPWVDCTRERIENEHLLPQLGAAALQEPSAQSESLATAGQSETDSASPLREIKPRLGLRRPSGGTTASGGAGAGTAPRLSVDALSASMRNKPNGNSNLFNALMIAVPILAVIGLLYAVYAFVMRPDKVRTERALEQTKTEQEADNDIKPVSIKEDEEARHKREVEESLARQKEEDRKAAEQKKAEDEAKRKQEAEKERKAKEEYERQQREKANKQRIAVSAAKTKNEFESVTGLNSGQPQKPDVRRRTANRPFSVYYYVGNKLVRERAGYAPVKRDLLDPDKVSGYDLWVKDEKTSPEILKVSPCIVWRDERDCLWYDGSSKNCQLFATAKTCNLAEIVFGPDADLQKVIRQFSPGLTYDLRVEGGFAISWTKDTLEFDEVLRRIKADKIEKLKKEIKTAESTLNSCQEAVSLFEKKESEMVTHKKWFADRQRELDQAKEAEDRARKDLNGMNDDKTKKDIVSRRDNAKKRKTEVEDKIRKYEPAKSVVDAFFKGAEDRKKSLLSALDAAKKSVESAKRNKERYEKSSDEAEKVRKMVFTISVEGIGFAGGSVR